MTALCGFEWAGNSCVRPHRHGGNDHRSETGATFPIYLRFLGVPVSAEDAALLIVDQTLLGSGYVAPTLATFEGDIVYRRVDPRGLSRPGDRL